jgi:hypothetical protein
MRTEIRRRSITKSQIALCFGLNLSIRKVKDGCFSSLKESVLPRNTIYIIRYRDNSSLQKYGEDITYLEMTPNMTITNIKAKLKFDSISTTRM